MRWFGPADTVTLAEIRQTGATGVYSALHDIPAGEVWPAAAIAARKAEIEAAGLAWVAVESVPVSEAIKTRTGDFARHLENYGATLANLGAAGIRTVVYNFMPVIDWVRTDLRYRLPDGAEALRYVPAQLAAFDLFALDRRGAAGDWDEAMRHRARAYWDSLDEAGQAAFTRQTLDLFPGVRLGLTTADFKAMLARYDGLGPEQLRAHLGLFLAATVPAAEAAGVRLAIHPDDPPFPVLGLPRIVSTEADWRAIAAMAEAPANGFCFCTGSLGARRDNDLAGMVRRLGARIHAVHLRSVQHEADGSFHEASHLEGTVDMPAVMGALLEEQAARRRAGRADAQLSFRPDHGHKLIDDFRRAEPTCPGYPITGRLRGLAELRGLQRGLTAAGVGV
ncbi:MAG: mannonate dehydratase [Opitutia bacterium Tous-C1TDCM]|nr:MAG: mannonate dehydratase [Opitutae bacterium Tous-C1TDCM]